ARKSADVHGPHSERQAHPCSKGYLRPIPAHEGRDVILRAKWFPERRFSEETGINLDTSVTSPFAEIRFRHTKERPKKRNVDRRDRGVLRLGPGAVLGFAAPWDLALDGRIRCSCALREDLIDRGSSLRRGLGIRPKIRVAECRPPWRQGGPEGRPREDARRGPVPPSPGTGGRGPRGTRRRGRERARPRDATGGTRGARTGASGENPTRRRTERTPAASGRRRWEGRPPSRALSERAPAHRERSRVRPERRVCEALPRQAAPRLRRHDRIRGQAAPPRGVRPGEGRPRLGRRRVRRGPL